MLHSLLDRRRNRHLLIVQYAPGLGGIEVERDPVRAYVSTVNDSFYAETMHQASDSYVVRTLWQTEQAYALARTDIAILVESQPAKDVHLELPGPLDQETLALLLAAQPIPFVMGVEGLPSEEAAHASQVLLDTILGEWPVLSCPKAGLDAVGAFVAANHRFLFARLYGQRDEEREALIGVASRHAAARAAINSVTEKCGVGRPWKGAGDAGRFNKIRFLFTEWRDPGVIRQLQAREREERLYREAASASVPANLATLAVTQKGPRRKGRVSVLADVSMRHSDFSADGAKGKS
jgi:hypothetical protein